MGSDCVVVGGSLPACLNQVMLPIHRLKVCAAAVVAQLNGLTPGEPSYVNTCYSIVAPEHGFSVAAVYRLEDGNIVPVKGAGGLSPMDASKETRAIEVQYALGWFKNITADMFT